MSQPAVHTGLPFMKMHGLGNDFAVVDARAGPVPVSAAMVRALADRNRGVGFDQLAVVSADAQADVALEFHNADGSTSAACGNAARCIARHEMDVCGKAEITLRTARGLLHAVDAGGGMTSVNMGQPVTDPAAIPLSGMADTLHLPIEGAPAAIGMGNPHCTFFVEDAEAVDLEREGPRFEHHPLFPERANVQFASVIGPDHLRVRVWERGAGVTLASGSSSCAVAVSAARRGLTGRRVEITLDGGAIETEWRDDGVWATGPTMHVFSGVLTDAFLRSLG